MTSAAEVFATYPTLAQFVSSVEGDFTPFKNFFDAHALNADRLFAAVDNHFKEGIELVDKLKREHTDTVSQTADLRTTVAALREQLDRATKLKPPTLQPQPVPQPQSPAMSTPGIATPVSSRSESPFSLQPTAADPVVPRARVPDIPLFPTQSTRFGRKRQDEYENWRSSLKAKMVIDRASFPREVDRILYTTQRLTGEAYARVRPLVDEITSYPDSPSEWPRNIRDFGDILKILNPIYITIDTFA
ncbi:hypothetical protein B0T18DRAFT_172692 [Schizothecium vesticola]|uniref:Uncharacterized protein n=1 Tax=Schizothecium vesticola TaxID=314040 RepID=A0AA40EP64_9PEZI|nr:hypothetical protein B0T18DRAFT_172692 [Schizothecium vesticola]